MFKLIISKIQRSVGLLFLLMMPQFIYADLIHYKIGIAFSRTDKYDRSTQQIINGIQIAKLYFEKKHPEYKIDFVKYTFQPNNLASVVKIANQICRDKILVVIGGEMSEDALVLGQILNSCHVVLVSPTATNPKVGEKKPFVFRVSASDDDVAKKLADYTYHAFKPSVIGIIDDVSLPYPDFLTKEFLNNYLYISKGRIIVKKVLRENIDYSSEIDDFIRKHVPVVVMLTYDIDLKRFVSQASERNYFPIYIGSDGWGSNESIVKIMRDNPLYQKHFIGYRNNYWKNDISNKLNMKFKSLYRFHYRSEPDAWNAIGFDSTWIVLSALSKYFHNINSEILKNEIAKTHNLQLLTSGNFEFKPNNTPVKDLNIYKITSNGASYITTLRGGK